MKDQTGMDALSAAVLVAQDETCSRRGREVSAFAAHAFSRHQDEDASLPLAWGTRACTS